MPDNPWIYDPEGGDRKPVEPARGTRGHRSAGRTVLAVLIVIGGVVAGGFVGFAINFGACFKSDCNAFEQGAMFYLPIVSLFFTVPLAYSITKPRD